MAPQDKDVYGRTLAAEAFMFRIASFVMWLVFAVSFVAWAANYDIAGHRVSGWIAVLAFMFASGCSEREISARKKVRDIYMPAGFGALEDQEDD